jgi:hypothetical protein
MRQVLLASAILILSALSGAQTQTTGAGGIPKTMASVRSQVQFLVGTFSTVTTFPANPALPNGATGSGTSTIAWALDSTYLRIDDRSVNPLFGNFLNFGMLGFDSPTGQFFLSMYNNYGDHPNYRGAFSGDTLAFEATIPSPRGTFTQRVLWFKDGSTVRMQVYNDRGKGPQLTLEQTATPAAKE